MVCDNGYLKLIDMGTCKKINLKSARKTFKTIKKLICIYKVFLGNKRL
jgi:hypothetical protein